MENIPDKKEMNDEELNKIVEEMEKQVQEEVENGQVEYLEDDELDCLLLGNCKEEITEDNEKED